VPFIDGSRDAEFRDQQASGPQSTVDELPTGRDEPVLQNGAEN
jgi:hypothetical protein